MVRGFCLYLEKVLKIIIIYSNYANKYLGKIKYKETKLSLYQAYLFVM